MGAARYLLAGSLSLAASQQWWLTVAPVVTKRQVAVARLVPVQSIGVGKPVCHLVGSHAAAAAFEAGTETAFPRPATGQQRVWVSRLLFQAVIVSLPQGASCCLDQLAATGSQMVRVMLMHR